MGYHAPGKEETGKEAAEKYITRHPRTATGGKSAIKRFYRYLRIKAGKRPLRYDTRKD